MGPRMESNALLQPNRLSSSDGTGSQDIENGFEIMESTNLSFRPPMNQAQFDDVYRYNKPEHKHSEFVRRSAKVLRQYRRPFESRKRFCSTILGFVPFFDWFPKYNWRQNVGHDFIAGCTLAVIHIPAGIAYGILAGLPAISGLYLSVFAPLLYMIFGTSRQNSLGTFAIVALMTRNALEAFPDQDKMELASTLSLTVGIVHVRGFIRFFM
uniref:Sulfate_transp domain-containing protein n=1 Tax=Bursaphelenchus xylophilus TaxID=6326 RepID=A0A1I7S8L8_BURXY